jgi:predicted aconitase
MEDTTGKEAGNNSKEEGEVNRRVRAAAEENEAMFLSRDEERVLNGAEGEVLARAMKLLVTLGDLGGAEKLVSIGRAQVAGVSYKTSGDATLELLESLVERLPGFTTKVVATQNPAGMDLVRWTEMGISRSFAEKQLRICHAYEALGVKACCTCTPYLSGNCPRPGEVVGFSESSAVAYVNSVLGGKTNRHGGLDALSAALVGKVPAMGFLLDANRKGDLRVRVTFMPRHEADYAALGYYVGKRVKTEEVPVYDGIHDISLSQLKLMGAASAASGAVALYHVVDVTPEARRWQTIYKEDRPADTLEVGEREIQSVYQELSSTGDVDLVAVGCPHCSIEEMGEVARLLQGRKVRGGTRFWVFTSPHVYDAAERQGYNRVIRRAGADVFTHTCMVVMPIEEMGIRGVAVNSAKAAFYIPRTTGNQCQVLFTPLKEMKTFLQ